MILELVELRQPPVSINDPRGTGSIDVATPLSGVLGSILGESAEAQKARIDQATREAKDLTDLVKRKKPPPPSQDPQSAADAPKAGGKRKVEFAEVRELGTEKRPKVESNV